MPDVTATPEPKANVVEAATKPSAEFLDRAKLELEIRLSTRQEYEELFKIWKQTELLELQKEQEKIIATGLAEYYKKWQEQQKPPEPENIQALLDQEYVTYTLPVDVINEDDTTTKMTFVIRELPQSVEKSFYRRFKHNILNKVQELEALTQSDMDAPFEKKVKAGLELMDEGFDVLAEAVVLILNPFGRKKEVDKDWVQRNICSDRQWKIVQAQMEVNRLRDFFSKVSTSSRDMMTMRSPNIQQLQQLVA